MTGRDKLTDESADGAEVLTACLVPDERPYGPGPYGPGYDDLRQRSLPDNSMALVPVGMDPATTLDGIIAAAATVLTSSSVRSPGDRDDRLLTACRHQPPPKFRCRIRAVWSRAELR